MFAGQVSFGHTESTASWLDPESNQTSRMFISFSNVVLLQSGQVNLFGRNFSIGRSYYEFASCRSNILAAFSTSVGVVCARSHAVQSTAGIGTFYMRCREMHQFGRLATMLYMRSWLQLRIQ